MAKLSKGADAFTVIFAFSAARKEKIEAVKSKYFIAVILTVLKEKPAATVAAPAISSTPVTQKPGSDAELMATIDDILGDSPDLVVSNARFACILSYTKI